VTINRRPYLYEKHLGIGAKMVPFGGWEMPLSYQSGTVSEHLACRTDAVFFDVSHLGTVRCDGDSMFEAIQGALTNDLRKIAPGRAQYTHLLNDDGFVVDDIIVWWVGDNQFDVMPNASNTTGVTSALPGVDITADRCVLAVQGPKALEKLAAFNSQFASVGRFKVERFEFEGVEVRVAGTGYTGERGVEISVPNQVAERVFDGLLSAGVAPAGLGARDTLRLEAALPLYGHELSLQSTTLEAGLGWVLGLEKEDFIGKAAVLAEITRGPKRRLAGIMSTGRQPLREGGEVFVEGRPVGQLSSGNFSPILEKGIGMGIFSEMLTPDTPVSVALRGREIEATVCSLPFVQKAK
jgi:aminomethyltransferase